MLFRRKQQLGRGLLQIINFIFTFYIFCKVLLKSLSQCYKYVCLPYPNLFVTLISQVIEIYGLCLIYNIMEIILLILSKKLKFSFEDIRALIAYYSY
jgi:hypothetical protein